MNAIIVAVLLISLLVLGSFAVSAITKQEVVENNCSTCGNQCTAENNCGLDSCKAVSGESGCGCNKR